MRLAQLISLIAPTDSTSMSTRDVLTRSVWHQLSSSHARDYDAFASCLTTSGSQAGAVSCYREGSASVPYSSFHSRFPWEEDAIFRTLCSSTKWRSFAAPLRRQMPIIRVKAFARKSLKTCALALYTPPHQPTKMTTFLCF